MPRNESTLGFLYGLSAYMLWGFFPLFFHLLRNVPSWDVLMHRVIWSFVFVALIMLIRQRHQRIIDAFASTQTLKYLVMSSLLISANWLIFIWAVAQGRVVECSLGYFITPLVSVFLARFFLKETLNRWQQAAIIIASIGLLWLIVKLGYLPWVSLLLALSFGCYGLVRKQMAVDSLTGLSIETAMMIPFAIAYWIIMTSLGYSDFFIADDQFTNAVLIASGLVTATPLLLFASATKKLNLSVIGFMMYINPTMQFISAVWILGEPFSRDQLIGFCFIWLALLVFSIGSFARTRKPPVVSG